MTLTINDTTMTSDHTGHTARRAPGSQHLWEVSWLPGRVLDRNCAITAMVLADHAREPSARPGSPPACAPSSTPTARPSSTTRRPQHPSPP